MFNSIYYTYDFQYKSINLNNCHFKTGKWCVVQKWENNDSIKHFVLFIKTRKNLPSNVSLIYICDDREYALQALNILSAYWHDKIHSNEIQLESGCIGSGYYLLQIISDDHIGSVTYKYAHSSDILKNYRLQAVEHSVYGPVYKINEIAATSGSPKQQFAHILCKEMCDFMVLPHLMDIKTLSSSILHISNQSSIGSEPSNICSQKNSFGLAEKDKVDLTNIYYSDSIKFEDDMGDIKNSRILFNYSKSVLAMAFNALNELMKDKNKADLLITTELLDTLCIESPDLYAIFEIDGLCPSHLYNVKPIGKILDNAISPADTMIQTFITIRTDVSNIMKNQKIQTDKDNTMIKNTMLKIRRMIQKIEYMTRNLLISSL